MIILALFLFSYISSATPEGRLLFENHCIRCHAEGSKKPLSLLRKKYRGNPSGVVDLAKRCPWGRGLSDMEIKVIADWLTREE